MDILRVPRDTPANIRIVARTLNLHRINTTEIDALCRIRWWQSWGFDPFEPTDEEEFMRAGLGRPWAPTEPVVVDRLTLEDWARITQDALRVGEPGYISMPQGRIMPAGEVISASSGWVAASLEVVQGNGIAPETLWPVRVNGRIAQDYDPRTNRYLIDGEWAGESDLLNHDDLPDM